MMVVDSSTSPFLPCYYVTAEKHFLLLQEALETLTDPMKREVRRIARPIHQTRHKTAFHHIIRSGKATRSRCRQFPLMWLLRRDLRLSHRCWPSTHVFLSILLISHRRFCSFCYFSSSLSFSLSHSLSLRFFLLLSFLFCIFCCTVPWPTSCTIKDSTKPPSRKRCELWRRPPDVPVTTIIVDKTFVVVPPRRWRKPNQAKCKPKTK